MIEKFFHNKMRMLVCLAVAFIASVSLWPSLRADGSEEPDPRRLAVRGLVAKAEGGDAKALYDLAQLHETGYDSIPRDSLRSDSLLLLSAEKGYAPAQNLLGFRLYRGDGMRRDVARGLEWMEKAALQGDPKAANNLGWLLLEGEGVSHDAEKAAFWFSRATEAGLPAGMAQYADMLRLGNTIPADTMRADSLYCRAIEAGLHDAEAKLLAMQRRRWLSLTPDSALRLGLHHYTHRAPSIGVTLFEQIADQLLSDISSSSLTLSSPGLSSDSVLPSDSVLRSSADSVLPSDSVLRSSADSVNSPANPTHSRNLSQKDSVILAQALALLGDAYTRGQGVSYDHDRSIYYFLQAAHLGNPSAQFIIGELLEVFPDALLDLPAPPEFNPASHPETDPQSPPSSNQNIDPASPPSSNPETDPPHTADWWLEQAAQGGIHDAAEANRRLFQPPSP